MLRIVKNTWRVRADATLSVVSKRHHQHRLGVLHRDLLQIFGFGRIASTNNDMGV